MSKRWKDFLFDAAAYILVIGFFALLVHFLCGCSPRYITVPEYHYEKHHTNDTIIERDSILKEKNTIIKEADSTMLEGLGIRLKEGERAILVLRKEIERLTNQQREVVHDTTVRIDSIRVPYPVEKQLTRWESLKMEAGGYILAILCILLIVYIARWFIKRKL